MGYDVHKFVEVVDTNLLCGICGSVFEDPVLTPCGHSFCILCLETWLETSQYQNYNQQHYQRSLTLAGSCPECRKAVLPNEAKPELSLRNLINGFYTYCQFKDQGCHISVKLEQAKVHASHCPHSPVKCAGCNETVQLVHLPNHQIHCRGIAEMISDDNEIYNNDQDAKRGNISDGPNSTRGKLKKPLDLSDLLKQMEQQMDILKKDLLLADVNNAIIESEYLLRKSEMARKREQVSLTHDDKDKKSITDRPKTLLKNSSSVESRKYKQPVSSGSRASLNWFEYPGDHGRTLLHYSTPTIPPSRLASFMFRFLLNKPDYVDSRMVFEAIQHCYDHFVSSSVLYDYNIHVLLALASASDWFTATQHQNFNQWLESLVKCRELLDTSPLS